MLLLVLLFLLLAAGARCQHISLCLKLRLLLSLCTHLAGRRLGGAVRSLSRLGGRGGGRGRGSGARGGLSLCLLLLCHGLGCRPLPHNLKVGEQLQAQAGKSGKSGRAGIGRGILVCAAL